MRSRTIVSAVAVLGGTLALAGCVETTVLLPGPAACSDLAEGVTGAFLPYEGAVEGALPECAGATHLAAGPSRDRLELRLEQWGAEPPPLLTVTDASGRRLVDAEPPEDGRWWFRLRRAGEFTVQLEMPAPVAESVDYAVSLACGRAVEGACGEFTRHPVLFMHGMAGTDSYLDTIDYWFGIQEELERRGFAVVMPAVDAFAPSQTRVLQWMEHLDALQDDGYGPRWNLLGHSQGGIDARLLASDPEWMDRVVSITTVASPHGGSPLADAAQGAIDVAPGLAALVEQGVSALSVIFGLGPAELLAATGTITTEAMTDFNAAVPDLPGVAYYSWSGRTCGLLEFACRSRHGDEVVDAPLSATYNLLRALGVESDGIVPVDSAVWGEHLGVLGADHFDEVGQIGGFTSEGFDHLDFYTSEMRRLAEAGL